MGHLKEKGFTGKPEQTEDWLAISVPRDTFTPAALENLTKLVENKGGLMARAFQAEEARISLTEDVVSFPWFPFTTEPDEVAAYTAFVEKLCEMAGRTRRVSGKPVETDNDKYTFRCFLLRLGFIGDQYKAARKILLKDLTGNTAFRHGR